MSALIKQARLNLDFKTAQVVIADRQAGYIYPAFLFRVRYGELLAVRQVSAVRRGEESRASTTFINNDTDSSLRSE